MMSAFTDTHAPVPETPCPHNCFICFKMRMQMKWILGIGCFMLLGAGGVLTAIGHNQHSITTVEVQIEYLVKSTNDIKTAMGLEIRMPPRLEALKQKIK